MTSTVKKPAGKVAEGQISLRNKLVVSPVGDGSPGFRSFATLTKHLVKYGESNRRAIKTA